MRFARAFALAFAAAASLFAAAAPAFADDVGERSFTFEIGGSDADLREDCSRRLRAWWDEITAPAAPPKDWDEKALGPWSLVVRTSGSGFVEERPGLVHVMLNVVEEELPSRTQTADAFAAAVLEAFRARVAERDRARTEPVAADAERELASALEDEQSAQGRLRLSLETHGGSPEAEAEALAVRRTELDRDAAQARIDRAVTARKLEAARAAADRAVELDRLRREADDAARAAGDAPQAQREALLEQVRRLRLRIDELAKSAPTLDSAREEVFRLEVALVGLEARTTVLAEERTTVTARLVGARAAVSQHAGMRRELDAAVARSEEARLRLREIGRARRSKGKVFQVIRAPGPPSREERKR